MRPEVTPVLLDVTRLIARSWSGRRSTGIDRVCYAYLRHYRKSALAVVQLHGWARVLDKRASAELFELLLGPAQGFRAKLSSAMPRLLRGVASDETINGLHYINVSHSDFHLPWHHAWLQRHDLRGVYLLHDLIPILHPEFSRPIAIRRNHGRTRAALEHAEAIIVTSEAVAADLRGYAAKLGLTRPDPVISPLAGEELRVHIRVEETATPPYFVSVGTIEPRKNHRLLIEAWRELASTLGETTPKLILVGQAGPMTGTILDPLRQEPALSEAIEWRQTCEDSELAELMAGATAVLCPSKAEGFGLPLVEALQMQKRILASDIPVFREIGQGLPQFLDPDNATAWVQAITQLLSDGAPKADTHFTAPTWADHFAQVDSRLGRLTLDNTPTFASSLAA